MISKIHISLELMVYFWYFWKDKIIKTFDHLESQDVDEHQFYGEYCMNFLGVRRQFSLTAYVMLHLDLIG